MINEVALQHFQSVCEREFQFLIDDFGFVPEPLPGGEFVNQFQYRLTNGTITLVVEGINYGANATIGLEDRHGHCVGIGSLLPGWEPVAKRKKTKNKNRLNQDQQIALAAQQLREYGQDILQGELERFSRIGDQTNNLLARFRQSRNTQQGAPPHAAKPRE